MARKKGWKSMTGISQAKRKIASTTGIPTTKQGRKNKAKKIVTGGGGGCIIYVIAAFLVTALFLTIIF